MALQDDDDDVLIERLPWENAVVHTLYRWTDITHGMDLLLQYAMDTHDWERIDEAPYYTSILFPHINIPISDAFATFRPDVPRAMRLEAYLAFRRIPFPLYGADGLEIGYFDSHSHIMHSYTPVQPDYAHTMEQCSNQIVYQVCTNKILPS